MDRPRCCDCGRYIRNDQAQPIAACDPCVDKRLEPFSAELSWPVEAWAYLTAERT